MTTGRQDIEVRPDPASFGQLARDVRAFDVELYKAMGRRIREVAKPLGQRVIREGAVALPRAGGLSARVAKARLTVSTTTGKRSAGVRLKLRTVEGYDLEAMNLGELRHPVFARAGRPRTWESQSIRAHAFSEPFERGAGEARAGVERAIADALHTIRAGEVRSI